MAKKKDSLALFEVYGKDKKKDPTAMPGWIGPTAPAGAAGPAADNAEGQQGASAEPVEPAARMASPVTAATSATPKPALRWLSGEPVVSSYDGQTRVSLNTTGWAIVTGVLVVLLAGTFMVGRLSATPKSPVTSPGVANTNGERKLPPLQGGSPAANTLVEGKHYLVIQSILGGATPEYESRGNELVKYLRQHDVPAVLATLTKSQTKSQQYVVLLDVPYDSNQDLDGLKWARQLEDMGAKKENNVPFGYNFKQDKEPQFFVYHKSK